MVHRKERHCSRLFLFKNSSVFSLCYFLFSSYIFGIHNFFFSSGNLDLSIHDLKVTFSYLVPFYSFYYLIFFIISEILCLRRYLMHVALIGLIIFKAFNPWLTRRNFMFETSLIERTFNHPIIQFFLNSSFTMFIFKLSLIL